MKKWYVIQTLKGQEQRVSKEIRDRVATGEEEIFILEREKEYRIKGEWIKDRKPFFPGYFFASMEESRVESFDRRLSTRKRRLMRVDGVVTPIRPEEQDYLMRLGGEDHIIYHSRGFRVEDYVVITSGPFKGYNGAIRKLDRHRRLAVLCVPLLGQEMEVEIGLEIVESKTFEELSPEEKLDRLDMARIVRD